MRGSAAATVDLHAVPAVAVGGPEAYLDRAGFWHGAIAVAAAWFGGAVGVAAPLRHAGRVGRLDDHGLAHLGAVDADLAGARALLREAAAAVDVPEGDRAHDDAIATARRRAVRVRAVVEAAVENAVRRTGRALGPGPQARDAAHAQRVADLEIYVRQSHAERDLATLGVLAGDAGPPAVSAPSLKGDGTPEDVWWAPGGLDAVPTRDSGRRAPAGPRGRRRAPSRRRGARRRRDPRGLGSGRGAGRRRDRRRGLAPGQPDARRRPRSPTGGPTSAARRSRSWGSGRRCTGSGCPTPVSPRTTSPPVSARCCATATPSSSPSTATGTPTTTRPATGARGRRAAPGSCAGATRCGSGTGPAPGTVSFDGARRLVLPASAPAREGRGDRLLHHPDRAAVGRPPRRDDPARAGPGALPP